MMRLMSLVARRWMFAALLASAAACTTPSTGSNTKTPAEGRGLVTQSPAAVLPSKASPQPSYGVVGASLVAPRPTRLPRTDDFGYLRLTTSASGSRHVDVDRVQMLSGTAATAAATARGRQVDGDFFLVDTGRVRSYALSPTVVVWGSIVMARTVDAQRISMQAWQRFLGTPAAHTTLFHVEVTQGVVVGVEEQYRP